MINPDHRVEFLIRDLPSPEAARRFFDQFAERNPSLIGRLRKNEGLMSDVLTLASYSPLLGTTLIQNPEYTTWLAGKRAGGAVSGKDDLLESLARFALTNSQLEPNVLLARFRRRELLRIFLRDIRRLGTIAEITEEISNLADAILEHAVRLSRQEMDNRYGPPFEVDEKGRRRPSDVCVVSLGKLGSKELNYSSDIDLLFVYSSDGTTTGGSREAVTNCEYFSKFAETVTQLVGRQTGEGAAYRVDMRLRPHGRVGAMALSLKETVRYYLKEARSWEQQVLIRSRPSAGDASLYKAFFGQVEDAVFRKGRDANEALREVFLSKQRIDKHRGAESAFDVKLGRGGIREIEFIAQALQLAHGGSDPWLRAPHTLISIARLADRTLLTEDERSRLSNAYDFLRRLEHILQMEHGLQTHSLPKDPARLELISAKMRLDGRPAIESSLAEHTENVHNTFMRVFGHEAESTIRHRPGPGENGVRMARSTGSADEIALPSAAFERQIFASIEKLPKHEPLDEERSAIIHRIAEASTKFAQMITSRPWMIERLRIPEPGAKRPDYAAEFASRVNVDAGRSIVLQEMRAVWSGFLLDIALADIYGTLTLDEVRARQTLLAEASVTCAVNAAARTATDKYAALPSLPIILSLGKLGSGTLDYDSDLDLIITYRQRHGASNEMALPELYGRAVEIFVSLLSGMTRDGNLYRIDLRLRPCGKNGPNVTRDDGLIDYIEHQASIWELLAYVQMRAIPDGTEIPPEIEAAVRESIRRRASRENADEMRRESLGMRLRLEKAHSPGPNGRRIDIKFGPGGLLDVYFVVRYLQLVDSETMSPELRSTADRLAALRGAGILSAEDHAALRDGHRFLSTLDHNIRLSVGRSSRLPRANQQVLEQISARMGIPSVDELFQQMSVHRMNIRAAFENIFNK